MAGKMAKQLAGSGTGQSLMDRVTQAKYSLAGSSLGKVVAKASTVELIPPKKKHLDRLIRYSNEPSVSIPLLVGFLVERTHEKSWVIVFKALITSHHLMNYGNEKISQYMASNNCQLGLPHFNDKSSSQSYEMSLFIRKYSKFLAEKTTTYQSMAFDFCKVKRGKDDGVMRTMPTDKLLKALPALRNLLNVLFEFEATEKDLNNQIINAAFLLLYKDLIRLFASYNEGMMNLIERYFSMKRSQCRIALDLYSNFPEIMNKVDSFLTVAENLGIADKSSMGLHPVPPKVLEAMQQHLALLEKKTKKSGGDENEEETEHQNSTHPSRPTKKAAVKVPLARTPSPARPPPPPSPTKKTNLLDATAATKSAPTPETHTEPTSNEDLLIGVDLSEPTPSPAIAPNKTEVVVTEPDDERQSPSHSAEVTGEPEESQLKGGETDEVNSDEEGEGLSTELQQEIIAAASSHYEDAAEKANQVVRQSLHLPSSPHHNTQTRLEDGRNRTPSRSRSPSPSRPPPPRSASPLRSVTEPRSTPFDTAVAVSDTETESEHPVTATHAEESSSAGQARGGVVSSGRTSPNTSISEERETTKGAAPTTTASNTGYMTDFDTLLDVDFDSGPSVVQPVPASTVVPKKETKPTPSGLDDLLSLDPLLDPGSSVPAPQLGQPSKTDPSGLPSGLKPAPANVVVRPLMAKAPEKKNPLDQLDSTLANLASSLGSSTADWGTTSKRK
uniref:Phosphatidylinositol-binding clathrin assembly protein n=2 Tax=Schistocephalus solidus TaxID=70667 RepID=A0A0X3NGH5_SCHSO